MNQAEEGFCELLELNCGVLEGGRSSEYVKKPKRAKIEPKRVKLMRKPKRTKIKTKKAKLIRNLKRAKIGPKRAHIRFCNVGGTRVMVEPTSVNARESTRTRS